MANDSKTSQQAFDFLVGALVTHRLTKLVVDDEIVAELRDKWFEKFPPESTKLGFLATCPWCTSFWAGLLVVVLSTVFPKAWRPLAYALAFSTITGWVEEHS